MHPDILNRKGARKVQDIPAEALDLLNQGKIETVNLTEWLAIQHPLLIKQIFPSLGIAPTDIGQMVKEIESQKKPSAMSTTKLVGAMLYEKYAGTNELESILGKLGKHDSDTVRGYAPHLIGLNEQLSIKEKLAQAKGLVQDAHFGVREVVWIALRPSIEKDLNTAIKLLSKWATDKGENVRRFATESTRPRGVWCKHIEALKENPKLALPLLEPLKSDPSKYVQDSVANWLNDASKSRPDFVIALCDRWVKESPTKETARIVKRARRTIDKG